MTILKADLTSKKQILSASMSSRQQLTAGMKSVVTVNRGSNIKTISLDGKQIPPDEQGNVNLDIGLDEINKRITSLESTSSVVVSFEEGDFTQNGQMYSLSIPLAIHQKGQKATAFAVKMESASGVIDDVIFQTHTTLMGAVVIELTKTIAKGYVYIIGG